MNLFKIVIFFILITLFSCVDSINDSKINTSCPCDSIIVDKYCALGASTASMAWQANVASNIARSYKCYAIGGGRWAHTTLSVFDTTSNASNNAQNNVMTNQLARLLKDRNEKGYYPDLITIMCGLNDAANGPSVIGNLDSAMVYNLANVTPQQWFTDSKFKLQPKTVYGSCRYVVETLIRNFPDSRIVIFTNQQCNNNSYNYLNALTLNNALKNIANLYSLSIVDIFNESGITIQGGIVSPYLGADQLHPNEAGGKLLTAFVTKRLRYLYFSR